MSAETCAVDGCTKQPRTRGWCNRHYSKWHRYGDPLAQHGNRRRSLTVEEMADLYRDGWTLAEIGEKAGITNERVRQLLPESLRREVLDARRQERRDHLAALVAEGLFVDEIAEECGVDRSAVHPALRRHDLTAEWEAAETLRRERRTDERGPCPVCGSLLGERSNAVTCGEDLCEQVWTTRALSRRLDPEVLRKHRVYTARWCLMTGNGTSRPERHLEVIKSGGRDVEPHGSWFVEGSQSLALAAECVRRGYQPVIDALGEREMGQVREYLSGTGDKAGAA